MSYVIHVHTDAHKLTHAYTYIILAHMINSPTKRPELAACSQEKTTHEVHAYEVSAFRGFGLGVWGLELRV